MVYLHVPFCRSFCTYCDFYSEIACKGKDVQAIESYVDGVCEEIRSRRDEMAASKSLNTLYIGGGTPSVLPPLSLIRIVDAFGDVWFDEFTMEVNPEDIVEKGGSYVASMKLAGVNRVSMGVQSLDDGLLRWMNRRHSADGARAAFQILRKGGISNISVDVIFGISQLSGEMLCATLDELVSWGPEHISAYQLSIEEGSALAKMVEDGRYVEAGEDQCRAQYDLICRKLSEAGYRHYEISNWAIPGYEAKHNSGYWKRLPYVGLGPGAHSFDGVKRSWNSQQMAGWSSESETLSETEAREESIMLGLRTAEGVDKSLLDPQKTKALLAEGALVEENGRLRIPEDHFFVSDTIISELV